MTISEATIQDSPNKLTTHVSYFENRALIQSNYMEISIPKSHEIIQEFEMLSSFLRIKHFTFYKLNPIIKTQRYKGTHENLPIRSSKDRRKNVGNLEIYGFMSSLECFPSPFLLIWSELWTSFR